MPESIRLHLLAVPFTITSDEYSHDAYTGKVQRFSPMMRSRGFEVYHYGIATSNSGANKDINLFSKEEWTRLRIESYQYVNPTITLEEATEKHKDPSQLLGELWNLSSPLIVEFNRRLKETLRANYRSNHTDIVCLPHGVTHDPALKDMNYTVVETGIGYKTLSPYSLAKVFESNSWMSYILGNDKKEPHNYWFTIPNYFNTKEFELSLRPQPNKIGFLGRLNTGKGCNVIVEIAKRFPRILFVLCGAGDPTPFLKLPNIQYKPPIHGKERSDYLGSCIAVLCPSKFLEPFCGVAVEAQLCGTPVICSDWGGTTETVEQWKTGVRCHTIAEYCHGIQKALDGEFDRAYIRDRAVSLYDMYKLAANYEHVFKTVLDVTTPGKKGWYSSDSHLIENHTKSTNSTSYSQLGQDKDVLKFYNEKTNGYFVEIGANDGIKLSNTLLLESTYKWKGICAEPIPQLFEKLTKNRPNSICSNKAVYTHSNLTLNFDVANDDLFSGLTNTIVAHKQLVDPSKQTIKVETISLVDLLDQARAPSFIEYLSLDTEGSEYDILASFDFSRYTFGLIDVEHNFIEPTRTKIRSLLIANGYVFKKENRWDDCYVHSSVSSHIHKQNMTPQLSTILQSMRASKGKVSLTHRLDNCHPTDLTAYNIFISSEPEDQSHPYDLYIMPFISSNPSYIYYPFLYTSLSELRQIHSVQSHKTKDCVFMYHRDYTHRNELFHKLNAFIKIDSLGKACNTIDIKSTRHVYNTTETFYDKAIQIYSSYRFVMAIENTWKEGYFTEKLILPILANSIPLYWGHPSAFDYINKKRIIYLPDYEDYSILATYLHHLSKNKEEYDAILREPIYTPKGGPDTVKAAFIEDLKRHGLIESSLRPTLHIAEPMLVRKRRNIHVIMSDNRALDHTLEKANYWSLVAYINKQYCDRFGYDFSYIQPYYKDPTSTSLHSCIDVHTGIKRHSSWAKLLTLRDGLQSYDYVVYIDSDCVFKNFDVSIEDIIQKYPDSPFIFQSNLPWHNTLPCAGFFICKNTPKVKEYLHTWYTYPIPSNDSLEWRQTIKWSVDNNLVSKDYNYNYKYKVGTSWEQDILWLLVTHNKIPLIVMTDDIAFQEKPNQFIRHVCSRFNSQRTPYFKAIVDQKIKETGISFEALLRSIHTRKLDTDPFCNPRNSLLEFDGTAATSLCEIMGRHGSDKGSTDLLRSRHNYTTFYYTLVHHRKEEPLRVFELGLGTNYLDVKSNMGTNGKPGASLRGWREFFPKALVFGADIDRRVLFEEERIKTYYCDQLNPVAIKELWDHSELEEGFDLLIEDGLHEYDANVCFLEHSLQKLKPNGIYIVEDILTSALSKFIEKIKDWKVQYPTHTFDILTIHHRNTFDNNVLVVKRIS
jgi:FkbM family methyltransferase